MDLAKMIEKNATQFVKWDTFENPLDFKSKLESEVYNYEENHDKLIFLYKIFEIVNKKEQDHARVCKTPDRCQTTDKLQHQVYFTEQLIKSINPAHVYTIQRPNVILPLIKQNLVNLIPFPDAAKTYQSALDKMESGKYDRNVLDDFRHCLETLLRKKLNNNARIEQQTKELGGYLKDKGIDDDLRNLVTSQLTYYSKYQNENVKHGQQIPENEIEYAINVSLALIRFLAIN